VSTPSSSRAPTGAAGLHNGPTRARLAADRRPGRWLCGCLKCSQGHCCQQAGHCVQKDFWLCLLQHSMMQHSMMQHSTARHNSTAQHSRQHSMGRSAQACHMLSEIAMVLALQHCHNMSHAAACQRQAQGNSKITCAAACCW
jgi:hypothetical protein